MNLTPVQGIVLGWILCSLMGLMVFFATARVFWMISFGASVLVLLVWGIVASKGVLW